MAFIALPSLLPLAAACAGVMRLVVLVLMTTVAAITGVSIVPSEDAQAGLAVFLVPYVSVPLTAVLWIGQAVVQRLLPWSG